MIARDCMCHFHAENNDWEYIKWAAQFVHVACFREGPARIRSECAVDEQNMWEMTIIADGLLTLTGHVSDPKRHGCSSEHNRDGVSRR